MSSEEKFKKSIQDLVASRQFEMEAGDWVKASAYLDGRRKRRRRLIMVWVLCGVLGAGWGLWHQVKPLSNDIAQSRVLSAAVKQGSGDKGSVPVLKQETGSAGISLNAPPDPRARASSESLNTAETRDEQPALPNDHKASSGPQVSGTPAQLNGAAVVSALSVKRAASKDRKGGGVAENRAARQNMAGMAEKERSGSKAVAGEERSEEMLHVKAQDGDDRRAETEGGQAGLRSASQDDIITKREEPGQEEVQAPKSLAGVPQHAAGAQPDAMPGKNQSGTKNTQEAAIDSTQAQTMAEEKPVPAGEALAAHDSLARKREPLRLFSLEGGALYMHGWPRPGKRDGAGLNPFAGILFRNDLSHGFSLHYGLQYYQIGKLNHHQYTAKVSRYSLGEESEVTVFTPSKIHYLAAPLGLSFSKAKHTLGVLCNIAYLLTVDVQVVKYVQKFNGVYDMQTSVDRGYTQGFNNLDLQAGLFYRRTLSRNWSAKLELFYGFSDVMEDDFFNDRFSERNRGLKLGLVYDIYH